MGSGRTMAGHMTRKSRLRLAVVQAALFAAGPVATACHVVSSNAEPIIEFTEVPPADEGGPEKLAPIAGRVRGARANQRIVLFALSAGKWWVQPFRTRPFTTIERDLSWKSAVHLGTEYAALLVEPDYRPPVTADSLPQRDGAVVAVSTTKGSGTWVPPPLKRLTFSGYDWEIRQSPNERFGQNDYDARNAWVDDSGHLHLTLTQRDGQWTSAEMRLLRSLGYGTYAFDLRDTSQLDPAAVFSMSTWSPAVEQNHREMDVDISRWGDPGNKNAEFAVQPDHAASNVFRFTAPSGRLTYSLRW